MSFLECPHYNVVLQNIRARNGDKVRNNLNIPTYRALEHATGLTSRHIQLQPKQVSIQPIIFSDKFNPNLYRPVIVPHRPRIMQDFIANGGKVTAFTTPDNTVIQLRKPQVHKVSNKLMWLTMKTKDILSP